MSTRYACEIESKNGTWEGIALFADTCDLDSMVMFAEDQFNYGNSITTPATDIRICDMETGEIVWQWSESDEDDYDPDWGYNEDMGFDPYMGCYTDDC